MATWAGFFKKTNVATLNGGREPVRARMDPYRLRSLPNDEIYFWSKRIDNSRVVRQADPGARGECMSAMGAAVLVLALGVSIIAPKAAWMMEGYKLESAKVERQSLLNQKRQLEVQEASLLSSERLGELAAANNLTSPGVDQVVHLDGPSNAAMATNSAPSASVPVTTAPAATAGTRNH